MNILQLQTLTCASKQTIYDNITALIDKWADKNPDIVCLGEMFNSAYDNDSMKKNAEPLKGPTWQFLSGLAKKYNVILQGGSISEKDSDGKLYNTAYVFDRNGEQIARHRKVHLFDVAVDGGICFKESDTFSAGDSATVFDTEFCRMGLCICFDFRFPELARMMVDDGAKLILCPASFNDTTGPAHWNLMHRQRAVDNQCFVITTSPALELESSYHSYGHSMVVDPWGRVVSQLDEKEGCAFCRIDLDDVDKIRRELPLLALRRKDIY